MAIEQLKVNERPNLGKGNSRELRRQGLVPAVVYGKDFVPHHVAVSSKEITKMVYREGFMSHILELQVGSKKMKVIPRDLQLHPVTDAVLHVDFLSLKEGATINVNIPIHYRGEDKAPGVKNGGVVNIVHREIELICDVDHIPTHIDIDISGLDIGDSIHLNQVSFPKGTKHNVDDEDFTFVTVTGRAAEEVVENVAPVAAEVPAINQKAPADVVAESGGSSDKKEKGEKQNKK